LASSVSGEAGSASPGVAAIASAAGARVEAFKKLRRCMIGVLL
jgi:hypothetical protein